MGFGSSACSCFSINASAQLQARAAIIYSRTANLVVLHCSSKWFCLSAKRCYRYVSKSVAYAGLCRPTMQYDGYGIIGWIGWIGWALRTFFLIWDIFFNWPTYFVSNWTRFYSKLSHIFANWSNYEPILSFIKETDSLYLKKVGQFKFQTKNLTINRVSTVYSIYNFVKRTCCSHICCTSSLPCFWWDFCMILSIFCSLLLLFAHAIE